MRKNFHRGSSTLLIAGVSFAVGILTAVFLPDIIIIVLLTLLLLLLCFMMLR